MSGVIIPLETLFLFPSLFSLLVYVLGALVGLVAFVSVAPKASTSSVPSQNAFGRPRDQRAFLNFFLGCSFLAILTFCSALGIVLSNSQSYMYYIFFILSVLFSLPPLGAVAMSVASVLSPKFAKGV